MSETKILEKYAESYREDWLDIYRKADEIKEHNSGTDTEKLIKQCASGLHNLITVYNSGDSTKTGVAMSYLLDTLTLARKEITEKNNTEDIEAFAEIVEMTSKTVSYVIKKETSHQKFWELIDREKTIENTSKVLKIDKTLN